MNESDLCWKPFTRNVFLVSSFMLGKAKSPIDVKLHLHHHCYANPNVNPGPQHKFTTSIRAKALLKHPDDSSGELRVYLGSIDICIWIQLTFFTICLLPPLLNLQKSITLERKATFPNSQKEDLQARW